MCPKILCIDLLSPQGKEMKAEHPDSCQAGSLREFCRPGPAVAVMSRHGWGAELAEGTGRDALLRAVMTS